MDIAIVRVDDDHVKIPSLKLLLSFGNIQQSAVLPLLKVLQWFIRQYAEWPFAVFLQCEDSLRHSLDRFYRSDVAVHVLLLHWQHWGGGRGRRGTVRNRSRQASMAKPGTGVKRGVLLEEYVNGSGSARRR